MRDKMIDVLFGPYATQEGVYVVALVEGDQGMYEEEVYYACMDDCLEDIADMVTYGGVDLEEDELEEDDDYEW